MTRRSFFQKIRQEQGLPPWPEFYEQAKAFHESWLEMIAALFGCEDGVRFEMCRPRIGVISYKKYLKARAKAMKLFHLGEIKE